MQIERKHSEIASHGTEVSSCLCVHAVTQPCAALCDPMDCSPPGSSVHGILEARILGGVPRPPPGDLHNHGSRVSCDSCIAGGFFMAEAPGKPEENPVDIYSKL